MPDDPEYHDVGLDEQRGSATGAGSERALPGLLPGLRNWALADDLEIVEAFARGTRLAQVALDMGEDANMIRNRYARITDVIRNNRGHMSIEGSARLLRQMRQICGAASPAAGVAAGEDAA